MERIVPKLKSVDYHDSKKCERPCAFSSERLSVGLELPK
jgi:hypothetical protein